jgi:hypothetical protein
MAGFEKNDVKLGIVVCKESVKKSTLNSKFAVACAAKNYHVYKVTSIVDRYTFTPFFPVADYRNSASMTVLVLETSVIN